MIKNSLLFPLCWLLSYSPFLRITNDSRFGEVIKSSLGQLRISLISFNLGKKMIHVITYCIKSKEFRLYNVVDLEKLCQFPNEKQVDKAYEAYKESLEVAKVKDDKLVNHKEALLYKINQVENTKNKTFNKYVAYIALIALVLPLFGTQLGKIHNLLGSYMIILLIPLIYVLVNLILFFNEFMKVRSYQRSTFKSIQNSSKPLKEFTERLYYEWYTIKSESTYQVTLILNIEKYVKGFIVISALILASYNIEQYISSNQSNIDIETSTSSTTLIHLTESSSNDFFKVNDSELTNLKNQLLYNNINKVIILHNEEALNFSSLVRFLDMYNDGTADIIELIDTNTQIISVIIIEED